MIKKKPAVTEIICDSCKCDGLGAKVGYMILDMHSVTCAVDGAYWPSSHIVKHLCSNCAKILQSAMILPPIDIVFAPIEDSPDLEFVEVEIGGKSIRYGAWLKREDGYDVLRIPNMAVQ